MIKLTNLMASTLVVGKRLTKFQEQQIARRIEKDLLKNGIVCDASVE